MKKSIVLLIAAMILATGCSKPEVQAPKNLFDPTEAAIGDMIAEMEILELSVGEDAPDHSARIVFRGAATISGALTKHEDDLFLGDSISFSVDEGSACKLPKLAYDDRNLWFVFKNQDMADALFQEYNDRSIRIEIDDYVINYAPTEVYNEATLIRIISE